MNKVCSKCGKDGSFSKDMAKKDGLRSCCKRCDRIAAKHWKKTHPEQTKALLQKWNEENPDRRRFLNRKSLLKQYNLTEDSFQVLSASQGGLCASCGEAPSGKRQEGDLQIDHDHVTGRVRGLLCGRCNKALGLLRDSPHVIRKLLDYASRIC